MTGEIRIRAEQAAAMLSGGHLFRRIWGEMDRRVVADWRAARDTGTRERLHLKQALLEELRSEMYAAVEAAARAGEPEEVKGFREILQRLRKGWF
jgi:hypothetical protein